VTGRVIAGVDGSDQSIVALRWAKDEAERREVPLVVIHAWDLPVVAGLSVSAVNWDEIEKSLEEEAGRVLAEAIEHAGLDPGGEAAVLIRGPAAEALLKSAHPDDLLVVGSRGLGGFKGLLLGSVSTHCAQHASCPVVVVPAP